MEIVHKYPELSFRLEELAAGLEGGKQRSNVVLFMWQ